MSGTSPKLSKELDDLLNDVKGRNTTTAKPRATTTVAPTKAVEKNYDMANNTFATIMFDENLSPEEKRKGIAEAMVFDVEASKEDNQKRLKEFDNFKAYLQQERKNMAQDIIALNDTEAFAEMQAMFRDMNQGIIEFDESLAPLSAILDAVYELRMQGKEMTLNVVKEINDDKEAEARREIELAEKESGLAEVKSKFDDNRTQIGKLKSKKSFFGLGPVKPEAQAEIAKLDAEQKKLGPQIAEQTTALKELKASEPNPTQFGEFKEQKERLRELLDISSDEHKDRQKRLVAAAQNFVNTTSVRSEQVLEHFGELEEHLGILGEANRGMHGVYKIVQKASEDASDLNKQQRDKLAQPEAGETEISKLRRTSQKADIEEYITAADVSAVETSKTYADLTTQGSRITTMKDGNREKVAKTRQLTSSGVAGVADGLSAVLTTVSQAALNESAEVAQNSVDIMGDRVDFLSQKESLRQAESIKDQAADLEKAAESLKAYSATSEVVQGLTREGAEAIKVAKADLDSLVDDTKETIEGIREARVDAEIQKKEGSEPAQTFNEVSAPAEEEAPAAAPGEPKPTKFRSSAMADLGKKGL